MGVYLIMNIMNKQRTCEFVTPGHPDKMCDQIADAILDACITEDKNSRVAMEVLGGHGVITLSGEITSKAQLNINKVVQQIVGEGLKIVSHLEQQSPEIAKGVDSGGAGDQGIMTGYATSETKSLMPMEYELARELCQKIYAKYPFDGKVQVTLDGQNIKTVVASFQNAPAIELAPLVKSLITAEEYLVNPAGDWQSGGFDADSGSVGRKIVVDNYGPQIPVGGGAFSGKDYTKVDRSAAYMARLIAVDYVNKGAATALVKIAYAIGKAQPVMAIVEIDGQQYQLQDYDLSPRGIKERLQLKKYCRHCKKHTLHKETK